MHQLVGMGEMRRMAEMREKIYLNQNILILSYQLNSNKNAQIKEL
jgi:hypothetical protein